MTWAAVSRRQAVQSGALRGPETAEIANHAVATMEEEVVGCPGFDELRSYAEAGPLGNHLTAVVALAAFGHATERRAQMGCSTELGASGPVATRDPVQVSW
jgi:hypothetical protein